MRSSRHSAFARADTLLPPGITGPAKGEILLLFRWTTAAQKAPTTVATVQHASVTWWGHRSPSLEIALEDQVDKGLIYSVACGPKAFSRYLKDMQTLKVHYTVQHERITNSVTDVDIRKLDFAQPVHSRTAISAVDGRLLGTAALSISMSYTPLVSSFEMHEHLASIDHSLPLFPTSNRIITPLRQLNVQSQDVMKPRVPAAKQDVSPLYKHKLRSSSPMPAETSPSALFSAVQNLPFPELLHAIERYVFAYQMDKCIHHVSCSCEYKPPISRAIKVAACWL